MQKPEKKKVTYKWKPYWQGFNLTDGTKIELDYMTGRFRRIKQPKPSQTPKTIREILEELYSQGRCDVNGTGYRVIDLAYSQIHTTIKEKVEELKESICERKDCSTCKISRIRNQALTEVKKMLKKMKG